MANSFGRVCMYLDDWDLLVDEREGAVLELAGLDSLAVDVGELLDLERPLHAGGVVEAATHHQQRLGLCCSFRRLFITL